MTILLLSAVLIGAFILILATHGKDFLGAITPAGIILLNVGVNMTWGLSFAWVLLFIPVPYGPVRIALNLLILYWPSIVAVALMSRGPPGRPMLRLLLGLWVAYVAGAALIGPVRPVIAGFRVNDPTSWLEAGAMAYAVTRLVVIAILVVALLFGRIPESAKAIARTVRVDSMNPLVAIALGAAFWGVIQVLWWLELSPDAVSAITLSAPFIVGGFLAERAEAAAESVPDVALERAAPLMPAMATILVFLGIFAAIGLFMWHEQDPDEETRQNPRYVNPVTGTSWDMKLLPAPESFFVSDFDPQVHEELRRGLEADGIPFSVQHINGREVLRVKSEYLEAVNRVKERVDPTLPERRNRLMANPGDVEPFRAWLQSKGVGTKLVKKRGATYVVWDPVDPPVDLMFAYEEAKWSRVAGVDYFRLYLSRAYRENSGVERNVAAFEAPEHRLRFEAWLRNRGVEPRPSTTHGEPFLTWDAPKDSRALLPVYVEEMKEACRKELREREKQGQVDYSVC